MRGGAAREAGLRWGSSLAASWILLEEDVRHAKGGGIVRPRYSQPALGDSRVDLAAFVLLPWST